MCAGLLREEKIRHKGIAQRQDGGLTVRFRDVADRDAGQGLIERTLPDLLLEAVEVNGDPGLRGRLSETATADIKRFALQQNITTLRNRVNELGVAEPLVQQQGENRIVVQLPGVQDTTRAKEILGAPPPSSFAWSTTRTPSRMRSTAACRPPRNSTGSATADPS